MERLNAALDGCYTIERELGQGGMVTAYLALDLRHDRKIALKVLAIQVLVVANWMEELRERASSKPR